MSLWKKTGKQSAKKENSKQLYNLKGRRCVLFNFNKNYVMWRLSFAWC